MADSKLKIARKYKSEIQALEKEQERLYKKAVKELGFDEEDSWVFEYFFNNWGAKEFEARFD